MILTVGNTKGGVGKTTLAINIALSRVLAGDDVLLIDGDEQQTASLFTELRTLPGYTLVNLYGKSLYTQVKQLAGKYDQVIIDVGGRDTASLRAALTISHAVLIPMQPRSFDLWPIATMANLISEARAINPDLKAYSMLNAADASGSDNKEAAGLLEGRDDIIFLPCSIGRRKAFPNAASAGLSVLEYNPIDSKAIAELESVVKCLYS